MGPLGLADGVWPCESPGLGETIKQVVSGRWTPATVWGRAGRSAGRGKGRCAPAGKRAFTLVEVITVLVIVLLLASLAAPRFHAVVTDAEGAQLRYNTHVLQDATERYTAEHLGLTPAQDAGGAVLLDPKGDLFQQRLLWPTDRWGNVTDSGLLGGYVVSIPVNPRSECSWFPVGPPGHAEGCAWQYDPVRGRIRPEHKGVDPNDYEK